MSKKFIMTVVGIALIFATGFFVGILPVVSDNLMVRLWGESPQEAYKRGCTDRDSLWISVMQKMTDKLAEQEFDATDTLPVVERTIRVDTFYSPIIMLNGESIIGDDMLFILDTMRAVEE